MDESKKFGNPQLFMDLLQRALSDDPDSRPSAMEMSVAFAERNCFIGAHCSDDGITKKCLFHTCAVCPAGTHYMCRADFSYWMRNECEVENDERRIDGRGELFCPLCQGDDKRPFPMDLLRRVLSSEDFEVYCTALKRIERKRVESYMQNEMDAALRRQKEELMKKRQCDLEIQQAIQKLEDVQVSKCPRCAKPWIRESDHQCMAITCSSCQPNTFFCGFCGEVAGTKDLAHELVVDCALNPKRGRSVFCNAKSLYQVRRQQFSAKLQKVRQQLSSKEVRRMFDADTSVLRLKREWGV